MKGSRSCNCGPAQLQWDIKRLTDVVAEKETTRLEYTADDLVAAYKRLPDSPTWFGFIRNMIDKKARIGRTGTAKTYRDALNSFVLFRRGEDLMPYTLSEEHISLYEAWLKSRGLKRNSSSCYLRTLRTLYRKAVGNGADYRQKTSSATSSPASPGPPSAPCP